MRTTILLPDDLYQRVRLTAAAERRTITSLIEEALTNALYERDTPVTHPPLQVTPITGSGLLPGVDIDDGAALLDLMDDLDRA